MVKGLSRIATLMCGLAFALAVIVIVPTGVVTFYDRPALIWVASVLLLSALVLRFLTGRRVIKDSVRRIKLDKLQNERDRSGGVLASQPRLEESLELGFGFLSAWEALVDPDDSYLLMDRMLEPREHCQRTTERYELDRSKLQHAISRTFTVKPIPYEQRTVLPVLRLRKGQLAHNLAVSCDGAPSATLSYTQSQGAAIAVLAGMYTAMVGDEPDWEDPSGLWAAIVHLAVSDRPWPRSVVDAVVDRLQPALRTDVSEWRRRGLVNAVRLYADFYVICVRAKIEKNDSWVRVRADRTIARADLRYRLFGSIRLALGLAIRTYILDTSNSLGARSYHLQGTFDDELYLFAQRELVVVHDAIGGATRKRISTRTVRLPRRPSRTRVSATLLGPEAGKLQGATEGLNLFHAYIRDTDDSASVHAANTQPSSTFLQVDLRERPPGTLGNILILSAFVAALVLIAGIFYDKVFPLQDAGPGSVIARVTGFSSGSSTTNGPFATVIFGLPALLSGWIIARFNSANLSRVSMSTFLCTVIAVLDALAAVTYAALRPLSDVQYDDLPIPGIGSVAHIVWLTTMLVCLTHFGATCVMFAARAVRFQRRLAGDMKIYSTKTRRTSGGR